MKFEIKLTRIDTTFVTIEVEASSCVEADRIFEERYNEGFETTEEEQDRENVDLGEWEVSSAASPPSE